MTFSRPASRRRYARIEPLEPRQLLTAIVADLAVVPQQPTIVDGDWQIEFPGERLAAEASSREFLSSIHDRLGIRADTTDLVQFETKHGLASTHTRFQQVSRGIPIHGATITVNQGSDGSIENFYSSTFQHLAIPATAIGGISFPAAELIAKQAASVEAEYLPSEGQLVWLPFTDDTTRLAWRIEVYSQQPVGSFLTLLDAQTGEVYSQVNRVAFDSGSGDVFIPNPYQTRGTGSGIFDNNDRNSANLTNELFPVTLQGLNPGIGLLVGEYVDLATLNSTSLPDVDANEPTRVYEYTRDDPRFEQVVIYHAIDSIQRYIHSLGFDDANPTPNGIRDFPTLANAHWYTSDQSFFQPGGNGTIHFGDGGVDDGEDADIIAHEYGHAIQHDQNGNWFGGETGAMGEGFGDYLAASFYAQSGDPSYQAAHAACVGEWDATSYSSSNPPCLRRVDGNKQYPNDLVGSVHQDGEIWSAALWDVRSAIGAATTDTLVLEHHFGLPSGATMPIAAEAIIAADANLNGGVNEAEIRNAFCDRGILTGSNCLPVSQPSLIRGTKWNDLNGDGTQDLGEPGLSDWVIFLDENQNGQFDENNVTLPSTDVPVSLLDFQTVTSTLDVSGIDFKTADINIAIDITHSFVADLTLELESPSGQMITLASNVGGTEADFTNTTFDDEAATSINNGNAPFSGSFIPQQSLSAFDGEDPNGTWALHITDGEFLFEGTLNSWSLSIESAESFATTDLNGNYQLSTEATGTFVVAEVQQPDWVQTFPPTGTHSVSLSPGSLDEAIDFGNQSTLVTTEVVGRHLFYNNSAFDGHDPAANPLDANAIASDKQPLFPGETAGLANYSSFVRGLNGVIIDIAGLADPALLSAADFGFRTGHGSNIANWPSAPDPSIDIALGSGVGGSDRVTLIWPDNTIRNAWLEVRIRATPVTGLSSDDLFYVGNAVGETGNLPGATEVNAADFQGVRQNKRSFLDPAAVDSLFDINRDRRIDAIDLLAVRDFSSALGDVLALIAP